MNNLQSVEKLIVEFYDPFISNQRRKEIDSTLQTYERAPISWKECMQYVGRNENLLVSSFCLKMVESIISRHWSKLPMDEKAVLHSSLSNYLLNSRTNIPLTIRKHLMKLIAKIVRNEWSAVGLSFFTDIMKVILSDDPQMVLLGLNFLLIASEELIDPRDTLCSTRKLEIRQNFESHIPQIFCLLSGTFHKFKNTQIEEQMYEILLQDYAQLFSWVPLSDIYTTELMSPIYECASSVNFKISMLALSALNEILYKNCVPSKNIPLVISICRKLNDILVRVSESEVKAVDDEYLSKILEAVSLIFSLHWHRIESSMDACDIISFVSSFYKLAFHNINVQSYRTCLEIWCNFLEYLTMRDTLHKKQYENVLITLVGEIIRKLYVEVSIHENMEHAKEDEEELDTLFNQHMNVLDLIIELIPDHAFNLIVDLWNRTRLIYIQSWTGEKNIDIVTNEQEILEALYAFRVCTQILTSLHSKIGDNLKATIAKNQKDVVILGANEYVKYRDDSHNLLYQHILKVHYALLKAIPIWICGGDGTVGGEKDTNNAMIVEVFTHTLPFVTNTTNLCVHTELQVAAAQLISCLTSYVKQSSLLQPLFADPTFKHLPAEACKYLQCALCNWVCICKSESYDERLKFLQDLFELVAPDKLENLTDLSTILRNCKVTRSDSKELLLKALEPWFEYVIEQYRVNFLKKPQSCDLSLTFLLESFRLFQNQLKSNFVEKMLFTFDSCLSNGAVENGIGQRFDKMMMLFTSLMEHPGHTYNEHISKILRIAQNIFFHVKEKRAICSWYEDGVDVEFYKLLCCVLLNKWQYFTKTPQVNGASELRGEELDSILYRILESFIEPDLAIYRSNLRCIEEMNTKWNLYEREIFRVKHLSPMLNTLLATLVEGKHKLLTDEILSAVYHMAAVNFEVFYNSYISVFLASISGLTEYHINALKNNINPQTDLPSFVQTVSQLINDVRSYQIENGF